MEDLSPRLRLVWDMQRHVQNGRHLRPAAIEYCQKNPKCALAQALQTLLSEKTPQNVPQEHVELPILHRQIFFLMSEHFRGESISESLQQLEQELVLNCEQELANQLNLLTYKLLFPLLGLIFPSMMIVLIFPLLRMLQF